jgi:Uncharacterized protein involved in cytokinesis, contains TGc (transglutaminase/protease-like) domain
MDFKYAGDMNSSEHLMKKRLSIIAVVLTVAFLFLSIPLSGNADGTSMYRDLQLNENEKAIYDAILAADLDERELEIEMQYRIYVNASDESGFIHSYVSDMWNKVYYALLLEQPLAYWHWGKSGINVTAVTEPSGSMVALTHVHASVDLDIAYDDDLSTTDVNELQEKMNALLKVIDDFSTDRTSKRDIVEDINNYLVNLVTYDPKVGTAEESPFAHDAYGALVAEDHYAVCDGYSRAFLLLCNKMNVNCMMDLGSALPSMVGHAWNYVQLDNDKWYAIDVTWNDENDNQYFLRGAETFFTNHMQGSLLRVDDTNGVNIPFNLPIEISKDKYDADPPSYEKYAWVFATLIVALLVLALYYSTREK